MTNMEQPIFEVTNGSLSTKDHADVALIVHKRKILRRFYEPLILLEALKRATGTPEKSIDLAGRPSDAIVRWRRSFVDGIAYLCASERFSNYVTAVALERTPQGLVLWLAANGGVRDPTVVFLRELLEKLYHVSRHDTVLDRITSANRITPILLRHVIDFNAPRLCKYINNVKNIDLTLCIRIILENDSEEASSQLQELCQWLKENFMCKEDIVGLPQRLFDLVLDCYLRRKRRFFEPLRLLTGQGEPHAAEFSRLCLLLDKLGKHVTTVRKIVEAAVHLSGDFNEPMQIETLRALRETSFPLTQKEGTLESILGRAFPSSHEADKFKTRLQSLWNSEEIETILRKERPRTTSVHAELLLAEHFYRNNLCFLDGSDRYIGCSKPTCYMCDAYLRSHPGGFAVPPSHQKIYLQWRCPDIPKDAPNAHQLYEEQEQIWLELIDWVRKDLKTEVNSRTLRAALPPDSTAGITSEGHPSFAPFEISRLMSLLRMQDEPNGRNTDASSDIRSASRDRLEVKSDSDGENGGVDLQ